MSDVIDNTISLATLFSELTTVFSELIAPSFVCVTDNYSPFDALKSTQQVSEKRLWLDKSSIKELIQNKTIKTVLWSETKAQLADYLTKKGSINFSTRTLEYEYYLNVMPSKKADFCYCTFL